MKTAALTFICMVSVLLTQAQEITFKVAVYNKINHEAIPGAALTMQDLATMRFYKGITDDAGVCTMVLSVAGKYRLEVAKASLGSDESFLTYTYILSDKDIKARNILNVELEKVRRAESGALSAIYFEYNQQNLSPENEAALNNLVKMLQGFATMRIEVGIYADCREEKELTAKRAKAITDFLAARPEAARVTIKEFGAVRPLNQCDCLNKNFTCPEEKYTENRRAEFKIVSF